jgi:hypothetical protein
MEKRLKDNWQNLEYIPPVVADMNYSSTHVIEVDPLYL